MQIKHFKTYVLLPLPLLRGRLPLLLPLLLLLLLPTGSLARNPDAVGRRGMVVSGNLMASRIGLTILRRGGNAIDAAVATGFALAVTEPRAGNIGGGGFMVIRLADGTTTTIDFRERAPAAAGRDMYLDGNGQIVPELSQDGVLATGVPGSVRGYALAREKYGTLGWNTLIAPAADLAENGYAVGYQLHSDLVEYEDFLKKYEATAAIFYPKSRPLRLNALFKQPDLAATLRRIAADGADEFYEGETAGLIVRQMNASGGLITMADLANYQAVERPAVEFDYRDVHVITMGPPSGGGIALAQILNQLERVDVPDLGYHSAGHVHAMAEAQKRAFADRTAYLGDPDFIKVPVQELISDDYAARRWGDFSELWATPGKDVANGDLAGAYESEYTTHFSVVDRHGNAVSVTTTINGLYGCGVAVAGAGFLLNNEMDDFTIKLANRNMWSLVGGVPNLIEPGKRMLSSMTPTIVTRDDKLMLVTGSPGGGRIITTVAQVISNLVDYEMDIKQAIDAPRIHHQWLPDIIQTERFTLSRETRQQLARMGHVVQERDGIIGAANSIYIDPANNWKHGAFDSRREAGAAGY